MINISLRTTIIICVSVFVLWLVFFILYKSLVRAPIFVSADRDGCYSEAARKKYCGDNKDCCLFWDVQRSGWRNIDVKSGCVKGYKFLGFCSDRKPIHLFLIVIPFAIISAILFALVIITIIMWINWTRNKDKQSKRTKAKI